VGNQGAGWEHNQSSDREKTSLIQPAQNTWLPLRQSDGAGDTGMKAIKPYKNGYLLILGNGKVQFWDEQMLKVMSMAYDEMRFVAEGNRKRFDL
jgi:hypothetical protein